MDIWNGESTQNKIRNARLLTTMRNGNRAEWDCTTLFYAILYSECIHSLHPAVQSNVDDLRKLLYEEFAHMPRGYLSSGDFQNVILKVNTSFHALGLSTLKIREIQNQTSFPTEELRSVLKKVDDLQLEVQEKETKLQEKGKELQEKGSQLQQKRKELKEKEKELKENEKGLEEKEIQRQTLKEHLQTEVSPFCILPPQPAHDVSPRGSEAGKITQHLKALRAAKNDSFSTLYLSGNPGSGKSQLARLTAMRFFDECKETPCAISFVMTLNAESSETLLESYASFARHCKCPHYSVTNNTNSKYLSTDEKIASLKTLISTKIGLYTSWLLVVDNVTNLSHVHTYLPDSGNQQWERGQLLITTQDTTRIPLTSSSIQHISISEGMPPEDASSMLRLLSDVTDDGTEKEIARSLDYQPLALASAAIYVRQVHEGNISNFGWDDYLKKLEKGQQRTAESLLAETNPGYPKTMTAAITIALEKAMSSDRVINHLFTFLSLCAPEPILKDIAINYIMKMEGEFEDKDAIGEKISRCPLLLFDEEESGVYIRVHGVVRYVVNSVTKKSAKEKQIKSVLGAVLSFSKFKDQESRVIGTKIVPHLAKVITDAEYLFSREGISQVVKISAVTLHDYSEVFKNLGKMCYEHSQYPAAKSCFTAALAIIKLGDPSNELEKTAIYSQLGLVHSQLGDLRQAKDCHERALDVYLKKLGLEHKRVAASYNNLGLVHCQLSDLNQAKNCYKRALDVYLKKLGPEHVYVASCYDNLGLVHHQLGDLKQAKDYHKRALDVYLGNLGPEHVNVATCYDNLGLVHRNLGDLRQAKDCHERALDVYLKHLGPEHVYVAGCYVSLCFIHSQLGDLKEAKECHERALDVYLKKLGPKHVYVATCYDSLGLIHSQLGDIKQAKYCHERALDVYLGLEHEKVAASYNNLGLLHRQLGDLEQARDCHERALDVYSKHLGPEHVNVAACYDNLCFIYSQLGDLKHAKDCHERALDVYMKKLGPEHVYVATCYDSLGLLHSQLGDLKKAKDFHERALDVYRKNLGLEHEKVAVSYNNLGLLHRQLGDLKQAKDCHERALDLFLKKLRPEHVNVAMCYDNLGLVYCQLGNLKQADDCHKRALDVYLRELGPAPANVAASYNKPCPIHRQPGVQEQGKDGHERVLDVYMKNLEL